MELSECEQQVYFSSFVTQGDGLTSISDLDEDSETVAEPVRQHEAESTEKLQFRVTRIQSHNAERNIVVGTYEGGMNIWECTWDLARYVADTFGQGGLRDKRVLELGCGHGLPGIWCLYQGGATVVTFQDLNADVLKEVTQRNVKLNCGGNVLAVPLMDKDNPHTLKDDSYNCHYSSGANFCSKAEFASGSWDSFVTFYRHNWQGNNSTAIEFDLILSSEGAYREESYEALCRILLTLLTHGGKAVFAMKRYYFGVGGSSSAFCHFVNSFSCTEEVDDASNPESSNSSCHPTQSASTRLSASIRKSLIDGRSSIRDIVVIEKSC